MEPIEHATKLLSASSYSTHGDVRFCFLSILDDLESHYNNDNFTQPMIANSIHHKLEEYWSFLDLTSQISSILDPRCKLSAFKNEEKENIKNTILGLSSEYQLPNISNTILNKNYNNNNTRNYFLNLRQKNSSNTTTTTNLYQNINSNSSICTNTNDLTADTPSLILRELTKYLSESTENNIDPITWWYDKRSEFPTLSIIAHDYLSVQATSVASEQAFSIAGQTISPQRNRLESQTARAILCLKSWIQNKI